MTSLNANNRKKSLKKHNANQSPYRKWLVLVLVLPIFILGYLISSQPSSDTIVTPVTHSPALADQVTTSETRSLETDADSAIDNSAINNSAVNNSTVNSHETEDADKASTVAPVDTTQALKTPSPKTILNAPLPETNSLAKEEIDRLEDERQRLKEQEDRVVEQLAMTKSLTQMKAEQIDLLEQQIAELEAKQAAQ